MFGAAVQGRPTERGTGSRAARGRATAPRRRAAFTALFAMGALLLGASSAAPVGAGLPADLPPIFDDIAAGASAVGLDLVFDGVAVPAEDAGNDQAGFKHPIGDIVRAWIFRVEQVPPFMLGEGGPFGCDTVVSCSEQGAAEPEVFAEGGWLIIIELAGNIEDLPPGWRLEIGALLTLVGYPVTAVAPGNLVGGYSHIIVVRKEGTVRGVFEYGIGTGSFDEFITRTHVRHQGAFASLLIPGMKDLPRELTHWGPYAFVSDLTQAGTGRDVIGNIGDQPIAVQGATVRFQAAAPSTAPTPTPAVVVPPGTTPGPAATAGPTPPSGNGGDATIPLVLIGAGVALALSGTWLLMSRRKPPAGAVAGPQGIGGGGGPVVGGGGPVIAAAAGDPCPPLLEAARRARAACEEALKAAAAAADRAREAAAEVAARLAELEAARKARVAAEKELARRQEEPDRSSWMSSGDRYEDSYDLKLKADARAAANAAYATAKGAATTDAERSKAGQDWQDQLEHIDSQEGLDELRRNDRERRAKWVKEAQDALDRARQAEADAQAAYEAAADAERAASTAAAEAKAHADAACDTAKAAEDAAMKAGCMPGAAPPAGGGPKPDEPKPEPPKPEPPKPTEPQPGDPKPTEPTGGGGGGSETPRKPRECEEGAEEWRFDTPPVPERFTVPVPGEKIQVSVSPSMANIDSWLERWAGFDADGNRSEVSAPGVPINVFKNIDATWPRDFRELERGNARHVEIEVILPLQKIRVSCERLWRCQNGTWVRTAKCRDVQDEPEPAPKTLTFERDAAKVNEITVFAKQCIAQWKAAEDAKLALDSYYLKCCK